MRIAIVNTQVPFVRGGAEVQAEALAGALRAHGHETDIVRLPFRWDPPERVLDHMLAARLTRLERIDRVIAFKFPAFYVPHAHKVMWVLHPHRQAYDLWGTPHQGFPNTPAGRGIRAAIIDCDRRFFAEARSVLTTSQVNARRLRDFSGIEAEVLHPPLLEPESYVAGEFGNYVYFPGRINGLKRQLLAASAMRLVRSGVRLVLSGEFETAADEEALRTLLAESELAGRIELRAGWIPQREKVALLANALGVLYTPYDEDFGYVTLEAFLARKPVITCDDSGGPLDFVQDGISGLVCPPEPAAIAEAIDRLHGDRGAARRMGAAGHERIEALEISWERVVERLLR
ncbi:MAG: glycosyltransferase family 4 protein [Solirubrobacteraceae bacterium]